MVGKVQMVTFITCRGHVQHVAYNWGSTNVGIVRYPHLKSLFKHCLVRNLLLSTSRRLLANSRRGGSGAGESRNELSQRTSPLKRGIPTLGACCAKGNSLFVIAFCSPPWQDLFPGNVEGWVFGAIQGLWKVPCIDIPQQRPLNSPIARAEARVRDMSYQFDKTRASVDLPACVLAHIRPCDLLQSEVWIRQPLSHQKLSIDELWNELSCIQFLGIRENKCGVWGRYVWKNPARFYFKKRIFVVEFGEYLAWEPLFQNDQYSGIMIILDLELI